MKSEIYNEAMCVYMVDWKDIHIRAKEYNNELRRYWQGAESVAVSVVGSHYPECFYHIKNYVEDDNIPNSYDNAHKYLQDHAVTGNALDILVIAMVELLQRVKGLQKASGELTICNFNGGVWSLESFIKHAYGKPILDDVNQWINLHEKEDLKEGEMLTSATQWAKGIR